MGFEVKFQKGLLADQAEIRAIDSTNFSTSFIEIVKQCVAKKVLDITVNVSGFEASFPTIKDSVLKLGQFVVTKHFKLKVIGDKLTPEFLGELENAGIAVIRGAPTLLSDLAATIREFEETGKLPANTAFIAEAESLKNDHFQLKERADKLETELKTFRAHSEVMKKSKISLASAKKELGKLQDSSQKSAVTLDEIAKKKNELVKITTELEEEEKKFADFVKRSDQENKKKEETFKKEYTAEKTRFQKLEQEFVKKSDARKAELKKLSTAPAGDAKK